MHGRRRAPPAALLPADGRADRRAYFKSKLHSHDGQGSRAIGTWRALVQGCLGYPWKGHIEVERFPWGMSACDSILASHKVTKRDSILAIPSYLPRVSIACHALLHGAIVQSPFVLRRLFFELCHERLRLAEVGLHPSHLLLGVCAVLKVSLPLLKNIKEDGEEEFASWRGNQTVPGSARNDPARRDPTQLLLAVENTQCLPVDRLKLPEDNRGA
eukprot:1193251-Prorocentrum_minimum.AAC.5